MTTPEVSTRRPRGVRISGLQAGIVMAVAAVLAGTVFSVRPPEAYGVCMACHGRDLVNWVVNEVLGSRLQVAPVALVFPLLTTVGVLIGGWFGAVSAGEYRYRRPRTPVRSFLHGMLVMNFGLLAAGCSTRLALRTAAGDLLGAIGLVAMVAGVVLATLAMRRRAAR